MQRPALARARLLGPVDEAARLHRPGDVVRGGEESDGARREVGAAGAARLARDAFQEVAGATRDPVRVAGADDEGAP